MQAGGAELVTVSRIAVLMWALIMAGVLSALNAAEVNVYWLTIWNGIICTGTAQALLTSWAVQTMLYCLSLFIAPSCVYVCMRQDGCLHLLCSLAC